MVRSGLLIANSESPAIDNVDDIVDGNNVSGNGTTWETIDKKMQMH